MSELMFSDLRVSGHERIEHPAHLPALTSWLLVARPVLLYRLLYSSTLGIILRTYNLIETLLPDLCGL
jgi:hypothetical protein